MCKYIRLFPSLNDEENEVVLKQLEHLKELNAVTFEFSNASFVLKDYINLPAIITDEGDRVDGLEPVKRFLNGQLRRAQAAV
ncbi:MAG: hypothetical protein M0Z35_21585 [Desulfitobacterium hafniense]|nr:hypothetical protein [Desulfitobacterium hafniense]